MRKRYETECTFKPAINEISKSLAKSKSVQELTENRRNRQIKHDIAARREQVIAEQCTFQPKVNTSRKAKEIIQNLPASQFRVNVNEPTKIVKAIQSYRKDRETKLRQTRQEVEYEAMKECTFAPDTKGKAILKQKQAKKRVGYLFYYFFYYLPLSSSPIRHFFYIFFIFSKKK